MARFEARTLEMRQQLETLTKGDRGRATQKVSELIGQWAVRREALFDELADPAKWKPFADILRERWKQRVLLARLELGQLFGDAARDTSLPLSLQQWCEQTLRDEDAWLSAPLFGVAAGLATELNHYQITRANLIMELLAKWSWLLDTQVSFLGPEQQAVAEVDRLLQEVLSDLDTRTDRAVLKIGELRQVAASVSQRVAAAVQKSKAAAVGVAAGKLALELVKDALGIPGELSQVADAAAQGLGVAHSVAETTANQAQAQIRLYRELLSRERATPLRMFKTNRDEVERYLRENANAETKYKDACAAISVWAQYAATPGQKTDAALLARLILANLAAIWEVNGQTDRVFREKFEGLFYGPLKTETLERLAQQYLFAQKVEQIKSRGGPRRIVALTRQLEGKVEKQIDTAFEPLLAFDAETPPEVRELVTLKNKEFRAFVRQQLEPKIKALLSTANALQELFGDSRIAAELDRQQLLDDIR